MVRSWPVPVFVAVTVTFGMAAPVGSVIVPARPEVPADWPINVGTNKANNRVSASKAMTCERSKVVFFIVSLRIAGTSFTGAVAVSMTRRIANSPQDTLACNPFIGIVFEISA